MPYATHPGRRLARAAGSALVLAAAAHAGTLHVPSGGPIQPTIDAAGGGDTVVIPAGTWFETLLIPAGKDGLKLKGSGKVILDARPDGVAVGAGITVSSNDVTISNLSVRLAAPTASPAPGHVALGYGISASGEGLTLVKVNVLESSDTGVQVLGDGGHFVHCLVDGCGGLGISIDGGSASFSSVTVRRCTGSRALLVTGSDARLEKCRLSGYFSTGVELNGANSQVLKCTFEGGSSNGVDLLIDNAGAVVSGNRFEGWRYFGAAQVLGAGAHVEKNKVGDFGVYGIEVIGPNLVVDGNSFAGTCRTSNALIAEGASAHVTGNTFRCVGGTAILADGGDDAVVDGNSIKGASSQGRPAMTVAGNHCTVSGNHLQDLAGDGLRFTGSQGHVTGNTLQHGLWNGLQILSSASTGNVVESNVLSDIQGEGLQNFGAGTSLQGNKLSKVRTPFTNDAAHGGTLVDLGGNLPALPAPITDVPAPALLDP